MRDTTDYSDAGFWLGYTFDFPAWVGFTSSDPMLAGISAPHPAGRGLCVGRDGMVLLRLPDGTHRTVVAADTRLVTEIPRVMPSGPPLFGEPVKP